MPFITTVFEMQAAQKRVHTLHLNVAPSCKPFVAWHDLEEPVLVDYCVQRKNNDVLLTLAWFGLIHVACFSTCHHEAWTMSNLTAFNGLHARLGSLGLSFLKGQTMTPRPSLRSRLQEAP